MHLKRLEIQGFKSFADKTIVNFSKDLTMIVGPNGSGKSNILDAIRWVLGEQSSKNLRGQNMSDVIFMGTEDRAPVSFASVTIVIDNEDGMFGIDASEIHISRKYFKTGDSKYFLNKTECRLLDVQGILLNTGLAKDGYSIIGQGKIDEILSLKSKDRRDFFDEATGVTKYRYKKDEAQKKLESTTENLNRLEDILHEKNSQLGPLENQSLKAKEYLKLAEKLKDNQVNLWKFEVENIDEKITKNTTDFEVCKQDIFENKLQSNKVKLEIDKTNREIVNLDAETEEINKKQEDEVSIYIKNQSTIEASKASVKFIESDNIRLENDLLELKSSLETLEKDLNLNTKEIDEKLEEKQNRLKNIQEINKKIAKIETNNYSLETKMPRIEFDNKKKNLERKEFELRNTESTIAYTKNSIENFEFLPKSVKHVLQNKTLKGVINTVANLISTDEKYSVAISTALGGVANNIITETAKDAISAVELLKKDRAGFATFLPLDKISARKNDFKEYLKFDGVLGSASSLVKFDKKYENVILRTLGDVLVVENSKIALEINKNSNVKMVTLEGETFHKGGAISGGKASKNLGAFEQQVKLKSLESAKITLETDIIKLKQEILVMETEISEIEKEIQSNNEISAGLSAEALQLKSENNAYEMVLGKEEQEKSRKISEIERIKSKITENQEQIADNILKIKADTTILKDAEQGQDRLDKFKEKAIGLKQEIVAKKEGFVNKIADLQAESSAITENRIDLERNYVIFENNLTTFNEKKDEILTKMFDKYDLTYSEMQKFATELTKVELSKIVAEINENIRKLGNINLDSIDEYIALKNEYEELLVQVVDIKNSRDEVTKLIERIEDEMKEVFTREFKKIAIAFEDTFGDLFGGGYGVLELSDPDDVLNSGVDIYVCPPGKKEKSLTLLSGGERAFVATAILFAIIKCKPTPFCILDEIDSALDDMNVKKYGAYLEKNSDKTQFLVITHRKGTMHAAKVIYGVTMENKGVSKLLRINVDEKEN